MKSRNYTIIILYETFLSLYKASNLMHFLNLRLYRTRVDIKSYLA